MENGGERGDRNRLLDGMILRLERYDPGIFRLEGPALLAVSGGRDSMLLLHLFARLMERGMLSHTPRVFHLDHRLRENSLDEYEFVERECESLSLPFHGFRRRVGALARRWGVGVEEAGRCVRYGSLARLSDFCPGSVAVTAHHGDDYLESLLIHLIRGGGAGSLGTLGMFSRLDGLSLMRPLLLFSRSEVDRIVESAKIPFRDDPSNDSPQFLRNRLRHSVVPLLRGEGLDPVALWRNFHSPDHPLRDLAGERPEEIRLDRGMLGGLRRSDLKTLLDLSLKSLGRPPADRNMVEALFTQMESRGRVRYETEGVTVWASGRGPLRLFRRDSRLFRPLEWERSGAYELLVRYNGRERLYRAGPDVTVREFREGDRYGFSPAPGRQGRKRLKKLLSELDVPVPLRFRLPLLVDGEGMVIRLCLSFWEGEDRVFDHGATNLQVRGEGT